MSAIDEDGTLSLTFDFFLSNTAISGALVLGANGGARRTPQLLIRKAKDVPS